MGLFQNRRTILDNKNFKNEQNPKNVVPVWFMRQAGRYHSHYQNIKKQSDFMAMCKSPELARDVTMGPIDDFHFDAAILFSDLLFPLEHLGMGLSYVSGPPTLQFQLQSKEDLNRLTIKIPGNEFYAFQGKAIGLLKKSLPSDVSLIGFVGAPFTLYTYAVEGSHQGNLTSSKRGFYDGRFHGFLEKLLPELLTEMSIQAENGADVISLFDTAVGELTKNDFQEFIVPVLTKLIQNFKERHPLVKIIYYSKLTHLDYLECLRGSKIDVLGIDWRMDLKKALLTFGDEFYIQGNLDPSYLHYPWPILEKKLRDLYHTIQESTANMDRWIMGLGHGVLQHTPEDNVRNAVKLIQSEFHY